MGRKGTVVDHSAVARGVVLAGCGKELTMIGCPAPAEGNQLLASETTGCRLIYSAGYLAEGVNSDMIVGPTLPLLHDHGEGGGGRTTAEAADLFEGDQVGFDLPRSTITLGGEEAVVLDRMPGRELGRYFLVVHDDRRSALLVVTADRAMGEP